MLSCRHGGETDCVAEAPHAGTRCIIVLWGAVRVLGPGAAGGALPFVFFPAVVVAEEDDCSAATAIPSAAACRERQILVMDCGGHLRRSSSRGSAVGITR